MWSPLHKRKQSVFNIFLVRILHLKKSQKDLWGTCSGKRSAVCCKDTGLRLSIMLDMRKDHKTQKNFSSVAVAPQLLLANSDSAICFKAAFPTSELKAHRPTHISEKWFGWLTLTPNLSQIICKPSILDNHVPLQSLLTWKQCKTRSLHETYANKWTVHTF